MKDPTDRTKIVVRRLPSSMSSTTLVEQIDSRFAGRYDWFCFRPGKNSQKDQRHSRAYINFKRPEDVVEFAEFFGGHIFVNEKGAQFKALVEYAPSQRVPKLWLKNDGREGTISKDPEYMEFLELVSKPAEHLPSAEIQLERKEAERAGAIKEAPIITPLMDFVRRKRAAKNGSQKLFGNGKVSKRLGVSASPSSSSAKRGSDRRKVATSNYVLKDSMKKRGLKDKPTYILMSRKEDQMSASDKSVNVPSTIEKEGVEDEFGPGVESGKTRFVLLKGKERESSDAPRVLAQHQIVASPVKGSPIFSSKKNQTSGRIIKSILTKEGRMDFSFINTTHTEQQMQVANVEDKHPSRPPSASLNSKDHIPCISSLASVSDDDKKYTDGKAAVDNKHVSVSSEKHERRTRNKDRPDRGVWAPLRRPDRSQSNDRIPPEVVQLSANSSEGLSVSQQAVGKVREDEVVIQTRNARGSNLLAAHETPLGYGERKPDLSYASRSEDIKIHGGRRVDYSGAENGSHRHVGRRGSLRSLKDTDSSLNPSEGKNSKRGSTAYSSYERQVWVQKSGSAS
ncbi:regulator of nonsense transcripts UPF3-like [Zingiber officinale]|uniref:regulator of nonsense transcripts UPF3-like n=1 Tax=Zingiber officinale TaxID=94328 RepID=UPI001C4AAD65|nr:regulator of nonsense transcripts UPF3-like [Zingiber officinale]XP_042378954.1 regulator of nonsense transcripts UPF3-like [Zingiber officinale]